MDRYTQAFIKMHVHVDAGGRVWCKGEQLEVIDSGSTRKVLLPMSKILYTFDDLKRAGARVDVMTLQTLQHAGASGRWKDEIADHRERGVPSNVYVANARTINRAIASGETPPPVKWVGRVGRRITEVFDTVDEVVEAMSTNQWRTEFGRGRNARKKP